MAIKLTSNELNGNWVTAKVTLRVVRREKNTEPSQPSECFDPKPALSEVPLNSVIGDTQKVVTVEDMIEWFLENYEDGTNVVPYDKEEHKYVYYKEGPYSARDILIEEFPNVTEDIIAQAAKSLDRGTSGDWVKKGEY